MSRVIRSSNNKIRNLHFDPISRDLQPEEEIPDDIVGQKSTALENTSRKAGMIIKEAESRAQQIEQEAYQKGYKEGLDFARAETARLLEMIKLIAEQALAEKWRVINSVEKNIIDLSLEIAEKIVSDQITVDHNVVVHVARKALMIAAERERIEIRVHPDDLEAIKSHKEELMSTMDGIEKIEVIADRRIKRGGCVLETSAGNVDAKIQSQLYQVEQTLKGVVDSDEIRD